MLAAKLLKVLGVFLIGVVPLLSGAAPAFATPPVNDNFADAVAIDGFPFSQVFDNSEAGTQLDEPAPGWCYASPRTVWYRITPATDIGVRVDMQGSSVTQTNFYVYEWVGSGIGDLSFIGCKSYADSLSFSARAGVTYYIQAGTMYGSGNLQLNVAQIPPPANDNFADAVAITTIPFTDSSVDLTGATREPTEPTPSCDPVNGTVWYMFQATADQSLAAYDASGDSSRLFAIYTGTELANLSELTCRSYTDLLTFQTVAGTTYYIQVSNLRPVVQPLQFALALPPPPLANFSFYYSDPTIFDLVEFYSNASDPVGVGIESYQWNLGDGTTATEPSLVHQYAKDGDYTAQLTVTTFDQRSATTMQIVPVRTHDVAIVKFTRPSTAKVGRTYKLTVGISNKRYPEQVQVELLKSTPQGYELVDALTLRVPVRSGSRTTDFHFSYTFTQADARVGKVSFKAIATILNGRDALPADNEFISFPTKVTPKSSHDRVVAAEMGMEDMANYVTDTVSNPLGIEAPLAEDATRVTLPESVQLFIPVVIKAE